MFFAVTGTRDPTESMCAAARRFLDEFDPVEDILIVGHARGIDSVCERYWVDDLQGAALVVPAMWNTHGRAAGPIRNSRMVKFQPVVVGAFPSAAGSGTQDMMKKVRVAGIPVRLFGK